MHMCITMGIYVHVCQPITSSVAPVQISHTASGSNAYHYVKCRLHVAQYQTGKDREKQLLGVSLFLQTCLHCSYITLHN